MKQTEAKLRVYLVDDEPLAVKRLSRLLRQTGRVEIIGSTTSPLETLEFLSHHPVDALFLDIQMPEMTGFELLARLKSEPLVIFTTAYDQYALDAFRVNSIDYLVKPIEAELLDRALSKLERLSGTGNTSLETERLRNLAKEVAETIVTGRKFPERISSRVGERLVFVDVRSVTHFYAKDKVVYAATDTKDHIIDNSISELEEKVDPARFVRIHRSTLLNLDYVEELNSWFGGGIVVRLKDSKRTELQVARDRVRELKARLQL